MIFKADLVEAINGLSHDLVNLSIKVEELEGEMKLLRNKVSKSKGRPVGAKDKKPRMKRVTPAQPRDGSGKFTKKK